MSAEARLKELGIVLPSVPTPVANYVPYRLVGNLLYLSGQGPRDEKGASLSGKVGKDVTVDEGYRRGRALGPPGFGGAGPARGPPRPRGFMGGRPWPGD